MPDNPALIDTLNALRARELAVIMQYMRHHYQVTGADGLAVGGEFKEVAITEMKHAEELAERIDFLGGDPTGRPDEFAIGQTTLVDMAAADESAERDAVQRYRDAIAQAAEAGDVTTRRMLEEILADEESHLDTFMRMQGR